MSAKLTEKLKAIVKGYFDLYKDRDELHITCDGNVFLNKNACDDHAKKADRDKWTVKRTDLEEKVISDELSEKEAEKLLLNTDNLDDLTVKVLSAIGHYYDISGKNKADWIEKLSDQKEALTAKADK